MQVLTTADITVAAVTGGSNNLTLSTGNNIAGADVTASVVRLVV